MFNPNQRPLSAKGLGLALGIMALVASGVPQAFAAASSLPASAKSGVTLFNKGQVNQSLTIFKSQAKKYPTNAAVQTWLGKAYLKQGGKANQSLATKAFETALDLNPSEPEALKGLSTIYSWYGTKRGEATRLLTQYSKINPNDREAKKQLALLHIWQGNYDEAAPLVNAVKGTYANDDNFQKAYAQYLTFTGSPAEAVRIYESMNAQSSSSALALRQNYVAALVKSGDYAKAKTIYNSLMSNAKSGASMNAEVMNAIAGMAFELGDYQEAVSLDTRLMQMSDADAGLVAMRLARSYQKLGDYQKSLALFSEMHRQDRLSGNDKVEYADVMTAALNAGVTGVDPSKIESIYREAIQESDDKVGLSLRLARLYSAQPNEFANAVNFYIYAAERDTTGASKKELVDYLKSSANNPMANAADGFGKALQSFPNDVTLLGAHAEMLSWNEATRPQALQQYLKLAQSGNGAAYAANVEQTLVWHEAKQSYMGLYKDLGKAYPGINAHKLAMARAYWKDDMGTPNVNAAYNLYNELYATYGDDPQFVSEFAGMLSQIDDRKMKERGLQLVEDLYKRNPGDAEVAMAYAKQLSYSGKGKQAVPIFDSILSANPSSRDALLGKANAYLYSGSTHAAADILKDAHAQYPNDAEIMKSLADAYKQMGRFDKALKIINESKGANMSSAVDAPESYAQIVWEETAPNHDEDHDDEHKNHDGHDDEHDEHRRVSNSHDHDDEHKNHDGHDDEHDEHQRVSNNHDHDDEHDDHHRMISNGHDDDDDHGSHHNRVMGAAAPLEKIASSHTDDFDATLNALRGLQTQTQTDLKHLNKKVDVLTDLAPGQAEVSGVHGTSERSFMGYAPASNAILGGGQDAEIGYGNRVIADEDPAIGNNVGARGDLYQLNELAGLREDINYQMRPTFRTGFLYTSQDGDETTNRLKHWAAPSQVSFQLTPNVRMRGGYARRRFYIPGEGVAQTITPRATNADQYSLGTSFMITDRLGFDGDISLETFDQSDSVNILYQARGQYQVNDKLKLQFGSRRSPNETSLLSYTGIEPNNGALAGSLVGQVRETSFFGEVNATPWKNWDANLGYEFALVDGENVPSNTKNQVFSSLGYNWDYADNHAVRLGYEFLYFGYDKDATLGYYNQLRNSPTNVLSMSPLVASPAGYILGGYFAPESFFLNSIRGDFRGNFFDNFLEYKIGGSVGVQSFTPGVPGAEDVTGAAYTANAQLTANLTDSISLYGVADYLDTAGVFSRYRFGGGLIYRPAIRGLMPVIGPKVDEI